jgi:hypothetical protein
MKRLRVIFISMAVLVAISAAFAEYKAEEKKFGCPDTTGCEYGNQYFYANGVMHQITLIEGMGYTCIYSPWLVCTWAYIYCQQTASMQWVPCKTGRFCRITAQGCIGTPWLSEADSAKGIKLSAEDRERIEALTAKPE